MTGLCVHAYSEFSLNTSFLICQAKLKITIGKISSSRETTWEQLDIYNGQCTSQVHYFTQYLMNL